MRSLLCLGLEKGGYMAQTVGAVALDIVVGKNNVSSAIGGAMDEANSVASGGVSKLSTVMKGVGGVALTVGKAALAGLGAAATGISALGTKAVSEYANYEQLVGGVETLFKDSSDKVVQYANNAYQSAGMSANSYMETVTGFSASLLQSLGGDTAKAAEQANMAVIDMSDNANKMGTDITMIQNAYQGFAKQNYTMLDNLKLGYGGTKQEMERLLADAEKISGIKYDISSFADITSAIHVMQQEMGIAGTTALEASTTIEGSINSMKGAWSNLLTGMVDNTQNIDVLIGNFADSIFTVADNLVPRISQVLDGISNVVEKLVPKITEKVPELMNQLLPAIINGSVSLVNAVVAAAPGVISALVGILPALVYGLETIFLSLVDAIPSFIQAICDVLPTLIPVLIGAVTNMIMALVDNFSDIVNPILNAIPEILGAIAQALVANAPALLVGLFQLFYELMTVQGKLVFEIIGSIPQIIVGIGKGIIEGIPKLLQAVGSLFLSIWDYCVYFFGFFWDIIKSWIDLIVEIVIAVFPNIQSFISNAWEVIKNIFSTAFEAIRNFFTNAFNAYLNIVKTVLNFIKNVFTTVFTVIKTVVTTYFNFYKTIITNVLNFIKNIVTTVWNAVKNVFVTVLNSIKTVVSNVWNGIKSFISNAMNTIRNVISNIWTNITTSVQNAMSRVFNAVKNGFNNVKSHITGLATQAVTWGKDMIQGIIDGIKSKISAVGDAVQGVAKTIKSFLHFSVPDEGPLTDYETWMPDFIDGMVKGIENNKYRLVDSVKGMANEMMIPSINAPVLKNIGSSNSVSMGAGSGTDERLYGLLSQLVANMQNVGDITIPVYLGNDLIDEQVVRASDRRTVRSGGRA